MRTIELAGHTVHRLGFGAMRLPGPGVWGEPRDPAAAIAVLRRARELGVQVIDTAWYYGPHVANRLIVEALHPYGDDLVIASKLGGMRRPDRSWGSALRPEELRTGCETDLRTLRKDRLDLVHLRIVPGAEVPFDESLDAMIDLVREGKIGHLGLSNVTVAQLELALGKTAIASVQNLYHVGGGSVPGMGGHAGHDAPDAALDACEARGIAFMPFFPLAIGKIGDTAAVAAAAQRHGVTTARLALACLLARSPMMLPIPGTSSVAHVEDNCAAIEIELAADEVDAIVRAARGATGG